MFALLPVYSIVIPQIFSLPTEKIPAHAHVQPLYLLIAVSNPYYGFSTHQGLCFFTVFFNSLQYSIAKVQLLLINVLSQMFNFLIAVI